jgi:cysteinyl-tRNA synthetase
LDLPLDIHGGGPDLKFPHHENEIAQTEGAFGGTLANHWMHCGPLMVDTEKMSKSLGNFRTIRQTIAVSGQAGEQPTYLVNQREAEMLRFFIVRNHYRSPQNYAPDNLVDAQASLDRLYQTLANVPPAVVTIDWGHPACQSFKLAMDDDFNSAGAVAFLFDLANEANRTSDSQVSGLMKALGGVLGLLQHQPASYLQLPSRYTRHAMEQGAQTQSSAHAISEAEIENMIQQRAAAKQSKHFAEADRIRHALKAAGVELEDKPGGVTQWRRA